MPADTPRCGLAHKTRCSTIRQDMLAARAGSTYAVAMSRQHPPPVRLAVLRRQFDAAAPEFSDADFVHRHCFDGLVERLEPMDLDVRRILDVGCAVGTGSRHLAKRFRRARVTSVDLSAGMLREARRRRSRFARVSEAQGDAAALPFQNGVFDLVVANLLLPWLRDPRAALSETARVLRNGGLLMFATFGPDSLSEIRAAWQDEDDYEHVNPFPDMHNIGDALVGAGLRDPVLDVDRLQVSYPGSAALFADLTTAGARNVNPGRRPTLTGKARFGRIAKALDESVRDGRLTLDLELVFGHAWGAGTPAPPGEFHVDAASIGRMRKRD